MKSGKKVEFHPPQEVIDQIGNVPQGTRLELMVNFAVKGDGRWCITAIEGVPMPGYDAAGNETNGQEYMDTGGGERMAGRMKEAMTPTDQGSY